MSSLTRQLVNTSAPQSDIDVAQSHTLQQDASQWQPRHNDRHRSTSLLGPPPKPNFLGLSQELATPRHGIAIQPKLTIGRPNDLYEQEADQVASQIVQRIHSSQTNFLQNAGEEPAAWQPPLVQRAGGVVGGTEAPPKIADDIAAARGSGKPLDMALQQRIGQLTGLDFSSVRIHADTRADELNRSLAAKAFTTGKDIFFRQGGYQPSSYKGQELIAHELTHVAQQQGWTVFHPSNIQLLDSKHAGTFKHSISPKPSSGQIQRFSWPFTGSAAGSTLWSVGETSVEAVKNVFISPYVSYRDKKKRTGAGKYWAGERFNKYFKGKNAAGGDISAQLEKAYGGTYIANFARSLQVVKEVADTIFKWSGSAAAVMGAISLIPGAQAMVGAAGFASFIASSALLVKYGLSGVLHAWTAERANHLYSRIRKELASRKNLVDINDLFTEYLYTLGEDKANNLEYGQAFLAALTILLTTGIGAGSGHESYAESLKGGFAILSPDAVIETIKSQEVSVLPTALGLGVDTVLEALQEPGQGVFKGNESKAQAVESGDLLGSLDPGSQDSNTLIDNLSIGTLNDILDKLPPPKHKKWAESKAYVLNPLIRIIWLMKKILNIVEVVRNLFRGDKDHLAMLPNALKVDGARRDNSEGWAYQVINAVNGTFKKSDGWGRKVLQVIGGVMSGIIGGSIGTVGGAVGGFISGAKKGASLGWDQLNVPNYQQGMSGRDKAEYFARAIGGGLLGLGGGIAGAIGGTVAGSLLGFGAGAKAGAKSGVDAVAAGQAGAEGIWQVGEISKAPKLYGVGAVLQGLGNLTRGVFSIGAGAVSFLGQSVGAGLVSGVGTLSGVGHKGTEIFAAKQPSPASSPGGSSGMLEDLKNKLVEYMRTAENCINTLDLDPRNP